MRGPLAAAALVAAAVCLAAPVRSVADVGERIRENRAKVDATHAALANGRDRLRITTVRAADLSRQLALTQTGIAQVGGRLTAIEARERVGERNLAWNHRELDAAQRTLALHDDALRRRLVDVYERGDLGYLSVLLSASSFEDFTERWQDIRYLIAANQTTIRDRRDAERKVSAAELALERRQNALEADRAAARQAHSALAALAEERSQLLAAATAARVSAATQVAQLESLSAAEESNLEALIRERQREDAARAAALAAAAEQARRAAELAGGRAAAPSGFAPAAGVASAGSFVWPASGPITSPFGMRSNPFGRGGFEMHPGIDIGAPMGATIVASAPGHVIFAGTYGGYGNTIIVDNGGSTSTLYGHCSQIFVADGQDVQQGQAIGAVGSTGVSTGPHLHFEIRVSGVPVEPTSRLH